MNTIETTDRWLSMREAAKLIDRSKSHVRDLVKAGAFGEVGDGTTETPVKRTRKGMAKHIKGHLTFIRESAVESYKAQKQAERESA